MHLDILKFIEDILVTIITRNASGDLPCKKAQCDLSSVEDDYINVCIKSKRITLC